MKKNRLVSGTLLVSCLLLSMWACHTADDKQLRLRPNNIDRIVGALTLEEKAHLVVGAELRGTTDSAELFFVGMTKKMVPGSAGTTYPIERLGIPAIVFADGPAGLRIAPRRDDDSLTYYCTGFPIGSLLASTWDVDAVRQVGCAMGHEVKEYGVDVILGPGMNIQRNPLCGRNFEYYSEDARLAGLTGAAIVEGIQSNGVGACVKHFAGNNQEINRLSNDSRISMRALREVYLRQFEIAVRKAQPWTLMTSYNYINGRHTSQDKGLLNDILRNEWGFEGAVVSDWGGGYDPTAQVAAGNDMIQPGKLSEYNALVDAVHEGRLSIEDLDACVARILHLITLTPKFAGYEFSNRPDLEADARVARTAAADGMVLLENRNNMLPIETSTRLALFGTTTYQTIAGGTGSGDVNKAYVVDIRSGLQGAGFTIDAATDSLYMRHLAAERERQAALNAGRSWFFGTARAREIDDIMPAALLAAQSADCAVITLGRVSGEGTDRHVDFESTHSEQSFVDDDFCLKAVERRLIEDVCAAFHRAGKQVVVVLNVGGVVETASWKELPDAILLAWQGGQECGNAVADLIAGRVSPSGRLPITFPVRYEDVPSQNFPNLNLNTGQNDSFYHHCDTLRYQIENVDFTNYTEDIFVGYRYYTTRNVAVSYPFGYGLSYSDFALSTPVVRSSREGWAVDVEVDNRGQRAARQVVQLYVEGKEGRPSRELVAFAKTPLLQPNQKCSLSMNITSDDLARFDESRSAWVTDKGDYLLMLCNNAASEAVQTVTLNVPKERVVEVCRSMEPEGELFVEATDSAVSK